MFKYYWLFASILFGINIITAILTSASIELVILCILGLGISYGLSLLEYVVEKLK